GALCISDSGELILLQRETEIGRLIDVAGRSDFIKPEAVVRFVAVGAAQSQCGSDDLALRGYFDDRNADILDHLPRIVWRRRGRALADTSHVEAGLQKVTGIDGLAVSLLGRDCI